MNKLFNKVSVYHKFGLLLMIILIALSSAIYTNQKKQIIENSTLQMESNLQDINNLFDLQIKEKQEQVNTALAVARQLLSSKGTLQEVDTMLQEVVAVNQTSKQSQKVKLQTWQIGDKEVLNNYEIVDQIQELTGQTATIFQKIDDGYLRISTNVRKLDGERAVGTFIPNESEVIKTIETGNTYRGRAFVVNSWYITAYDPIYINGQIKGILYVGVQEKDLSFLKEKFYSKLYYETGYPYALTQEGEFLLHKTREGEKVADQPYAKELLEQKSGVLTLQWGGQEGKSMVHFLKFHNFYGIIIGIAVPEEEIFSKPLAELRMIIISGFGISLVLMLVVVRNTANSVVNPLKKVNENLTLLAQRKPIAIEITDRKDEVSEINRSLFQVYEGMTQASVFADTIGKGNFDAEFSSLGEEDKLGNSLLQMRNGLKEVAIQEKRRQWINEGIAQFGDVTRKYNNDLKQLCQQSIVQLVKYSGANQGAFYLLEGPETLSAYLELKSCYAYDRVKHSNQQIMIGEGLVGQAVLEKDYIYLTDVPQKYVKITSGLGEATPTAIIVIPLINNDQVQGVIEMAFFKCLAPYEIEFLQKVAETIASAVSSVKINDTTKRLLEQSQQQAEELRAQEEEMRQNMEEMQATQEDMNRMSTDQQGQLTAINKTLAAVNFTKEGIITRANHIFLQLMGYSEKEVIGQHHSIFVRAEERESEEYRQFWQVLSEGGQMVGDYKRVDKKGNPLWLKSTYTAVKNSEGKVVKVIKFAIDITEQKQLEDAVKEQLTAAQDMRLVLEESQEKMNVLFNSAMDGIIMIDERGTVELFNLAAEKMFQYKAEEIVGKNIKMLMPEQYSTHHDGYLERYKNTKEQHVIGMARSVHGQRKDNTTFPLEIRIEKGMIRDRRIFVGILRDLSALDVELFEGFKETDSLEKAK